MIAFESVQECLANVLDFESEVGVETPLDALEGWDSVNALRVLTNFERTFSVRLPLDAFVSAKTVGDLYRLLSDGRGHVARS